MAKLAKLLQAAAGAAGGGAGLNVEEVFSTYLYTGNATADTNITTGVDLNTNGGLLWTKKRSASADHYLFDTENAFDGALSGSFSKRLKSNDSTALGTELNALTSFDTDGFTISTNGAVNGSGSDYASWTFRKAPKFFDVVTYTGTGSATSVAHDLGADVGMVIVKKTSGSSSAWRVWHRGLGGTNYLTLNTTAASASSTAVFSSAPSSTQINLGHSGSVNASGESYVAYLFAHNDGDGEFGPDGDADIIKCGSYTGDDLDDGPEIDLGFEPQWLMVKNTSTTRNWIIVDNMRGIPTGGNDANLYPNLSNAEDPAQQIRLTPTGFKCEAGGDNFNGNGHTMIYIAIRRGPMAVPTDATDVFGIDTGANSTPSFDAGFPIDASLVGRVDSTDKWYFTPRLTGSNYLNTATTAAESSSPAFGGWDYQTQYYGGNLPSTYQAWMWRRAPNFFDVVAYTGNGTAGRTVSHNLGVAPEMMWVKSRNVGSTHWVVYHSGLGNDKFAYLSATNAAFNDASPTAWDFTTPSSADFTLGAQTGVNQSGYNYIAYLFASLDGVSKVGSFSHTNNTTTSVDCGFSSGARFVMIKLTDGSDSWYIWDTERGINAGTEPFLRLNTNSAQITGADWIDPLSSGFQITGPDLLTGTYIFYAIA